MKINIVKLLGLLWLLPLGLLAQEIRPVAQRVVEVSATQEGFYAANLLSLEKDFSVIDDPEGASYYKLDTEVVKQIITAATTTDYLVVVIPQENGEDWILDLAQVDPSFYEYEIITSSGGSYQASRSTQAHFRGVVRGQLQESLVALSFFEGEIAGFISTEQEGTLNLGKLPEDDFHILFSDLYLDKDVEDTCQTSSEYVNQALAPLYEDPFNDLGKSNSWYQCLKVYFEVDYRIYQEMQSDHFNTSIFVIRLFNQVATLYNNERIDISISTIFLWDTPDSYANSVGGALAEFVRDRATFNGDLAHLLTYSSRYTGPLPSDDIANGEANGIGGFRVIGNPNLSPHSHTSLYPVFEAFPNFSRQVSVIAHEIGHNLGSRHTHACVWNGNNTAIDGCGRDIGDTCPQPPIPARNFGTIMSYCDRYSAAGINFRLGFGQQPGNIIRNNVARYCSLLPYPVCSSDVNAFKPLRRGSARYLEASNSITASHIIYNISFAIYHAGNEIRLLPGFEVERSGVFHGYIEGCTGTFRLRKAITPPSEVASQPLTETLVEEETSSKMLLFPNPANEQLTIQWPYQGKQPALLQVYDFQGKVVMSQEVAAAEVNLSTLAFSEGLYILKILSEGQVHTKKFVVKR